MNTKEEEKRKKSKNRYGKSSNHGYDGCSSASGCGPNFEIILNIKERKESQEKE